MVHCSGEFSAGTTEKVVFHFLFNRIFRKRFVKWSTATVIEKLLHVVCSLCMNVEIREWSLLSREKEGT